MAEHASVTLLTLGHQGISSSVGMNTRVVSKSNHSEQSRTPPPPPFKFLATTPGLLFLRSPPQLPTRSPLTYPLTAGVTTNFLHFSPVPHCPLGLGKLQACPFADIAFPPLPLSAASSAYPKASKNGRQEEELGLATI